MLQLISILKNGKYRNFRKLVLAFPGVTEQPHFEKASFRVSKKIFCTLDSTNHQVCIKLSVIDQDVFSAFDKTVIFPVPNKWGRQGWTFINLKKVRKSMRGDALATAYSQIAPTKLTQQLEAKEAEAKQLRKTKTNTKHLF